MAYAKSCLINLCMVGIEWLTVGDPRGYKLLRIVRKFEKFGQCSSVTVAC